MIIPGIQKIRKIPNINEEIKNIKGTISESEARKLLIRYLRHNITIAAKMIIGIDIFPFQDMLLRLMYRRDYVLLVLSRGMSKSWTTAVFCILYATLEYEAKIAIISKTFRQSRMILQTVEDLSKTEKNQLASAELLRQCLPANNFKRGNDEWEFRIGKSIIKALPLGDGSKLRGFRFDVLIIDEYLLMPESVVNEVLKPFLSTNKDPVERERIKAIEDALIEQGEMTEDERTNFVGKKMIALSSASFKFESLYKLFAKYVGFIEGKPIDGIKDGTEDFTTDATYGVAQLSYFVAPPTLFNQNVIDDARKTMSKAAFDREYGSKFTDESGGYFSMQSIMGCVQARNSGISLECVGDPNYDYILAIDPSWAQNATSDMFAMVVGKVLDNDTVAAVHFYARIGAKQDDHIRYIRFLLENFNIKFVILDNGGGVQLLDSINSSIEFSGHKKKFTAMPNTVKLNDKEETTNWDDQISEAKKHYSLEKRIIGYFQTFPPSWIKRVNEKLLADFDHRRMLFGHDIDGSNIFSKTKNSLGDANLSGLKFLDREKRSSIKGESLFEEIEYGDDYEIGSSEEAVKRQENGKMVKILDLIERQDELSKICRSQIAAIEANITGFGNMTFDLEKKLTKDKTATRVRKDLYSAMLLLSWGHKIFTGLNAEVIEEESDFEPVSFDTSPLD